ncbi:arylesterase [Pedobacter metabolipauper]|uniref:Acyl-CoA thioesterase-1 n=1 Tax=Pedobacter metabolipauper TaxID=425513 RepID=A0A4R6T0L1_9SPHI|nr:arylesterase [Pedobacter metabolipauper]TDQ11917.1 acyl-CoA thioesterase-1 [Pedobacter metabolipauper]
MKRILFLGDSLTAGYGLANVSLESLPALLQENINALKLEYKITNAGISGDTSAGGLQRVDVLLYEPVDVFVLELGANDILRGISPATTHKNLQAIISKVKNRYPAAKMLLLGMEIPAWIPGTLAASFRNIFRTLASDNDMALVPFLLDGVLGVKHLNLNDGLHPTAAGYRIVATKVWPVLKQLIG